MKMASDPMLCLLQVNDSSYPSGAYAHSFGLEEMVDSGVVSTAAELESFLERQVLPTLLCFEVPMFAKAYRAAQQCDPDALLTLDQELDAWRIPAETREASRRIGSQRLELLETLEQEDWITRFWKIQPRGHHLVVTAMELSRVPLEHAARAFAYQTIAGLIAASMKLIRIGQNACQKILRRILCLLGNQIDANLLSEPYGWFNPLLEISSLRHAHSHARLFIS
ncbi:MAG: urease accessory protein UreF [Verrucomicrobia bacterium]|nr:MAG: urease accessory protein UreF [Verrucomicrobiota bacterium]